MEFTKSIEFNKPATVEQELIITYNGFLSDCTELTIVYGFGESWEHTTESVMIKTQSGFYGKVKMLDYDTFNFCFRGSNGQWDNNYNNNYISQILPCSSTEQTSKTFDIDALIEEILQPIITQQIAEEKVSTSIQISSNPIDLGLEISNILSEISQEESSENLTEYSSLDEILSCEVINQTPVELFENQVNDEENMLSTENIKQSEKQTALVTIEDPFIISPRKLNKFYSIRKRIKVSLYKLFVKLPKLIFGLQEQ